MPYVFDAYGTLFDFHAAVSRHHAAAGPDAAAFSEVWRLKQIEYTWTHTLAGRYVEFWTLTQRALDYCFERFPSVDRKLRDDLLNAYLKLDAYPDALAVLRELKSRGERTAILTNGSPAMVGSAVEAAGLEGRARRRALGRHGQDVQAAPRGLRAGHPGILLPARRRGVRVVEPLGCLRRDRVRLPHRSGSTAPRRRTNIRISRRPRWCRA